jgi:predicted aspartyl protease
MIQMRENRYEDIRKDVVNRSHSATKSAAENNPALPKTVEEKGEKKLKKDKEGHYDEYNSWS